MAHVHVPESLPEDSQASQRYNDYAFEATQLSQPQFSQTQNTQATALLNSQVEPRRKYWAILIPTNAQHSILKLPWAKPSLQVGRGPHALSKNDIVLAEKRISNVHCRFTLGLQGPNGSGASTSTVQAWKDGETEPEVWIEDLGSSNGTYVNGQKVASRRMLQHGDEISLGHASSLETHDVRYIFRSVGGRGISIGTAGKAGEVYERYQLLDRLGKGTFAEVRKAVDVETGDMRAIKQIIKHRFIDSPKTLNLFQREIDICQRLQHENICRLIEWFEDPQHICLVLEYVDGGDLLDYIMNWPSADRGLPEDHTAKLTLQICRAMAYTHEMGVTHRDLKPENILLTRETSGVPRAIKIADFGLAKMVHAQTMLTSMVGTPQYLAPEVVMQTTQRPGYENVVDSWSVGIIVYSMMTKALPFDEDETLTFEQRIRSRYTKPFDSNLLLSLGISDQGIDFISRLLAKDPGERMTMVEALEHEWLAGPSSQTPESPQHGLGGDSVWSIESFDVDFVPDDDDDEDMDGRWTRPMTASGTNLESAVGPDSDESFSQPMQHLRLTTRPASDAASPPSPPLTDAYPQPPPKPTHPPLTPSPSTTLKRKLNGVRLEAGEDLFSSGSLSPPPEPAIPPPRTRTRKSATATPKSVLPSPRRSTRPRKSMKLA